jgi:hypothetical protein
MEKTPIKVDCYLDRFFDYPDGHLKVNGSIVRIKRRSTAGDELSLVYGDREINDLTEINNILEDHRQNLKLEFDVPTILYVLNVEGIEKYIEVCKLSDGTYILLEDCDTRQKFNELQCFFNWESGLFTDQDSEEYLSKLYSKDPFGWFPLKSTNKGDKLLNWFATIHHGRFYRYYPLFFDKRAYDLTVLSVDQLRSLGIPKEDAITLHETIKCASSFISPYLYDLVRRELSNFINEEDLGCLPLLKADLIAEWANVPLDRAKTIEKYIEMNFPAL